jgi:hypothetical protein
MVFLADSLDHPQILRATYMQTNGVRGEKKDILSDSALVQKMEKPAEFNRIMLDFLSSKAR